MHTFKLKILTPDKKLFEGEVVSFTVPTQSGEITVLKNHAPLISIISIGQIRINLSDSTSEMILVQGGVVDVKSNSSEFEVVLLVDQLLDSQNPTNLDEEIIRAKEAMKVNAEDIDFALEESIIERNLFIKRMKAK